MLTGMCVGISSEGETNSDTHQNLCGVCFCHVIMIGTQCENQIPQLVLHTCLCTPESCQSQMTRSQ